MKLCTKCGVEKDEVEFCKDRRRPDGLLAVCRTCSSLQSKAYHRTHAANVSSRKKGYAVTHAKEIKERKKAWRVENPEKAKASRNARQNKRMKEDPVHRLAQRVRVLINISIKLRNTRKRSKTFTILGCTILDFYGYLGEPVENAQLDHICPMAQAQTEEEVLKLNHFSNFRWLSAEENLAKSSNWTPEGEKKCLELLGRPWQTRV